MGFLDSLTLEKPDSYDLTDVLDYSPESLGSLYQQFESDENRGVGFKKTIRKDYDDFEGLGKGQIVISDDKEKGTVTRWVPYMGKEWVDKQNLKFQQAEAIMNAPLHLAPLLAPFYARSKPTNVVLQEGNIKRNVPITQGGQTFLQQKSSNRYKKQFMYVDELLNIADAKNVTPTPPPNVSGTGNQALIPKYAQSAKIYVGDKIPTSVFSYDGTNVSKTLGISERMVTGKSKSHKLMRERISADNPMAQSYRELIAKYDKLKENIGDATLDTVIPKAEFESDVRQLIELKSKDGLDLPNKTSFSKELGNFAIDGKVQRWGSKGVLKPVDLNIKDRLESQAQFPTTEEFDPQRPKWKDFFNSLRHKETLKLGLDKPEKDHLVRLKNQVAILSNTLNAEGEFVRRPAEFMDQLAGELHRRGHNLGDQNLNFLMMSTKAHRTGKYSRHVVSQDMTDAEVPKTLAEAQQQQLSLHDGRTIIAEHKNGKYYLDGVQIKPKEIKEKGNYYFAGREYEKSQRQGLSLTTRKILAKIDNPKDLADAYELFATDAGAHEIMSGIQTAASFIYDNDAELDALSRQIRTENIPNMIKFLKYTLKNVPQYKDDPVYTELLNRFTDKLNQNMADYFSDLRQRGS